MEHTVVFSFPGLPASVEIKQVLWNQSSPDTSPLVSVHPFPSVLLPFKLTFDSNDFPSANVGFFIAVDVFKEETDITSPPFSFTVQIEFDGFIKSKTIVAEDFKASFFNPVLLADLSPFPKEFQDEVKIHPELYFEAGQHFHANRAYVVLVKDDTLAPQDRFNLCTIDERYNYYLTCSEACRVNKKPSRFIISANNLQNPYVNPYNAFPVKQDRLEKLAKTLSNLGFNTVIPENWWYDKDGIPHQQVNNILDRNGIDKRQTACNAFLAKTPFANDQLYSRFYLNDQILYMHYFLAEVEKQNGVNQWVQNIFNAFLLPLFESEPGSRMASVRLIDEPSWYIPQIFESFNYNANSELPLPLDPDSKDLYDPAVYTRDLKILLEENNIDISSLRVKYTDFLKSINTAPEFWGQTDWNNVKPLGAGTGNRFMNSAATESDKRVFYYTMRFLHKQASMAFECYANALSETLQGNSNFNIAINPSNLFGASYFGNQYLAGSHNLDKTNDGANMCFDYFDNGRVCRAIATHQTSHGKYSNCLTQWFESAGLRGLYLPRTSFHAELIRSAAMLALPDETTWNKQPQYGEPGSFGTYVLPNGVGKNKDELAYRVLSFIGRGAKQIDYFRFGPLPSGEYTWSDSLVVYPWVAEVQQLIGNAEDVLYPGRPARSQIAVLITKTSEYYNSGMGEYMMYQVERSNLHHALSHAGFSVDYIDEIDIANGKLIERNYKVLYLTDPNLPDAEHPNFNCVNQIEAWVSEGGVLAVVAGAAVSNELNNPGMPVIDQILGIGQREDIIVNLGAMNAPDRVRYFSDFKPFNNDFDSINLRLLKLEIANSAPDEKATKLKFVKGGQVLTRDNETTPFFAAIPAVHPVSALPLNLLIPSTALVVVTLEYETPPPGHDPLKPFANAVTENSYGKGFGFAYSFFPGHQYAQSADYVHDDKNVDYMPFNWATEFRNLVLLPVKKAGLKPPATVNRIVNGQEKDAIVETLILSSDAGYALTLLNWQGQNYNPSAAPGYSPADHYRISLTVNNPAQLSFAVRSAKGTPCSITTASINATQSLLTIALDALPTVDVLSITPLAAIPDDACNCTEKCKDSGSYIRRILCEWRCKVQCELLKFRNKRKREYDPLKDPKSDGSDWGGIIYEIFLEIKEFFVFLANLITGLFK